jgi:hypothetical protein
VFTQLLHILQLAVAVRRLITTSGGRASRTWICLRTPHSSFHAFPSATLYITFMTGA